MGALVEKSDISIAHRLPERISNARLMIVRFFRRVSKVELLKKKKFEPISIDEFSRSFQRNNGSATQIFNLMKQDYRFKSIWTREGSIFLNSRMTTQCIVYEDSMKEE